MRLFDPGATGYAARQLEHSVTRIANRRFEWPARLRNRARFAKNAASNLARGSVGAAVAILLPALLVRHMSRDFYSIWSLILQVGAYVGYLDFGLQTAIGRYVACANEKQDSEMKNSVVSTAFAGLCIAALLGLIFVSGVALFAAHLFPAVPAVILPEMRMALLVVGFSIALGLPASTWNGVFVGLQRYEIPALTNGGAKVLGGAAIALIAMRENSLTDMAIAIATVNLISYAFQYGSFRAMASDIQVGWNWVHRSVAVDLGSYCLSLTVWSFCMLLVSGLDLVLVGRFDFASLGFYAVASSLVTFVAGLQSAIFSAMMPHAAAMHASGDTKRLGALVLSATRLGTVLLSVSGLALFIYSKPILRMWVGPDYASHAEGLMSVLLIANIVRLVWVPYSVVLLGAGEQKLLTIAPVLEGITNLVLSLILGLRFGAAGVAFGTLGGAVAGSLANILYTLGHSRDQLNLRVRRFLLEGIALPSLVAIPLLLVLIMGTRTAVPGWITIFALAISAMLGIAIAKRPVA